MKNFLLVLILGTLPFLATGKPIPAITDSLGNRIYNLNAITIISNPNGIRNCSSSPVPSLISTRAISTK